MKISVSLSEEDVTFLDAYAEEQGIASRSAALHKAVRLLRAVELSESYADAWEEWGTAEERGVWNASTADGLTS